MTDSQPVLRALDTGLEVLLYPEPKYREKFGPLFNQPTGKALIHYMNPVNKISSKGKKQNRILLLSNNALYLTEVDSTVKRCVPVKDITQVVVAPASGCIGFRISKEYDILLELNSQDPAKEVHYLLNILKVLYQKEQTGILGTWVRQVDGVKKRAKPFDPPLLMSKPKGFKLTLVAIPVLSPEEIQQMLKASVRPSPLPDE
eukprot:TRINITY_DN11698_c0_g2_i2.p1 TRINITY_DN11698_c0_g2~~TRINITY_DN11698_c0_g2_i2.p1  ORF type:complete len:202 (+),score=45.01 TRINITY_DN11698_c0_g2_i2:97-702(+)